MIDCWHGPAVDGQAQSVSKAFTGSMAKAVADVRLKAPYPSKGTKRCLGDAGCLSGLGCLASGFMTCVIAAPRCC